MMKRKFITRIYLSGLLITGFCFTKTHAQQWNGPDNTTSSIGRTGNVGIGTLSPKNKLQIHQTNIGLGLYLTGLGPGILFAESNTPSLQNPAIGLATDIAHYSPTAKENDFVMRSFNGHFIFATGQGVTQNNHTISERMRIDYLTGNVGIGTTNPVSNLHVSSGTTGDAVIRLEADPDNNNESDNPWIEMLQDGGAVEAKVGFNTALFGNNKFGISRRIFNVDYGDAFVIDMKNGNVGIDTKNPQSKLAVNGKITAKAVEVTLDSWADYVFDKDYALLSLEETEKFIEKNKHLPDVPSEEDVLKNGVDLGEMNKILLQKTEELTLHLINMKKKFEQEIESLKAQLKN